MLLYPCLIAAFASTIPTAASMTTPLEETVAFTSTVDQRVGLVDTYKVSIQVQIKEGWHIYDVSADGSETNTSLSLELPQGLSAKGDWSRPAGEMKGDSGSSVYAGQVTFSQTVVIGRGYQGDDFGVTISYQACTDEYCNRPQEKKLTISIPERMVIPPALFEKPVRLMVDGKPLNSVSKNKFPSPAIYDVDRDGKDELVVTGLWGKFGYYENLNAEALGDPVWGSRMDLKAASGELLRASNW